MLDRLGHLHVRVEPPDIDDRPRPAEEADFLPGRGDHELIVGFGKVTDRLTRAVAGADVEFALVVEDPLIVLCYRFGDAIPWSHAVSGRPTGTRNGRSAAVAVEAPERRDLIRIVLIEQGSRLVRATRNATLSLDFSRELRVAIRKQAARPPAPVDWQRALARLRQRSPTTQALLAHALARSIGSP